jgi:hypothetical protein
MTVPMNKINFIFSHLPGLLDNPSENSGLKRAILTKDIRLPSGAFERQGYIALFEINNVRVEGNHLRFDFIKRIAELN